MAATLGPCPPLRTRDLVRPMLFLVAGIAVVTTITGVSAARHAEMFDIRLEPFVAAELPPERHHNLFIVACYHLAAYASAIIGSVVLCVWVACHREPVITRTE